MASKSLGTLTVDLIAKTGGFVQGMTAAERQADKSAKAIKRRHQQLAADLDRIYKGIAVAAAAAFATIAVSVKKSTDDMLRLGIAAKQIAMPVDEFSALAAVAKNADVSMDSLSVGLRTMAKNLALAQQGSKQAADAFKAIGLDPAKLKDSKTAFLAISDALSRYRDDVNKTAIEQTIFGRSGAELNGLLGQGSVAIANLMDKQRELGNVVTPAAAESLAQYDEATKQLTDRITGLRNRLAIALLPTITSTTTAVDGMLASMDKGALSGFTAVVNTLARAGLTLAGAFVTAGNAIGAAMALADRFTTNNGDILTNGKQYTPEEFGKYTQARLAGKDTSGFGTAVDRSKPLSIMGDFFSDTAKQWSKLAQDITNFGVAVDAKVQAAAGAQPGKNAPSINLLGSGDGKAAAMPDFASALAKMQAGFGKLLDNDIAAKLKEQVGAEHAAVEAVAQYGDGAQKAAAQQTLLNEQVRLMTRDMLPQLTAMGLNTADAMKVINDRAADLVKTSSKQFDALTTYAEQAARNMLSAFADFLFDPMQDGFKGLLRSFGDMLRRMSAQIAASQLLKALGTWMGGSSTGWVSAIGNAISSYGGGKAVGGPVNASTTYLVGEKGPELFTPGRSGTITPNHQLGGGGLTYNAGDVIVDGESGYDPTAVRQLSKMIDAQTKQILARALQPGGLLWKQRNGVTA